MAAAFAMAPIVRPFVTPLLGTFHAVLPLSRLRLLRLRDQQLIVMLAESSGLVRLIAALDPTYTFDGHQWGVESSISMSN